MNRKFHYSWIVCLGCALVFFCTSGLAVNAFTIYQPYILKTNQFTNAQSSMIITIRSFASFLSMFLTGMYYKRFSLRTGLSLAGLFTALAFVLFGLAGSFPAYCLAAVVMGFGYGLGTLIPIAMLLERWFIKSRNLALSLCSAVTGLSTFGIPTLLIRLIGQFGLRTTFIAEGAFIAGLSVLSFFLIRSCPEEIHLEPYQGRPELNKGKSELYQGQKINSAGDGSAAATGKSHIRELKNGTAGLGREDWMLLVPVLLAIGAMTCAGYSHLSVLITANDFSVRTAALAMSVSGIALTLGKCLFGSLSEKLSVYRCNTIFGAFVIFGLVLLCRMGNNEAMLYGGILFYSVGLALTTVGLTTWAGDWSTGKDYDKTVRRFQMGYAAGGLLFSSVPGIMADHAHGSYVPAYIMFAGFAAVILLAVQMMYKKLGLTNDGKVFHGKWNVNRILPSRSRP